MGTALAAGAREQLATILRGLGLVEVPAGRMATDARATSSRRPRTTPSDRRTAGEVVA